MVHHVHPHPLSRFVSCLTLPTSLKKQNFITETIPEHHKNTFVLGRFFAFSENNFRKRFQNGRTALRALVFMATQAFVYAIKTIARDHPSLLKSFSKIVFGKRKNRQRTEVFLWGSRVVSGMKLWFFGEVGRGKHDINRDRGCGCTWCTIFWGGVSAPESAETKN